MHAGIPHTPRRTPPGSTHTPGKHPPPRETAAAADGTHPTGMHSCFFFNCFGRSILTHIPVTLIFYISMCHILVIYTSITGNLFLPWQYTSAVVGEVSAVAHLHCWRWTRTQIPVLCRKGNRDVSPSLYNGNSFCTVQCSHQVSGFKSEPGSVTESISGNVSEPLHFVNPEGLL